jgi:hypothetical protein
MHKILPILTCERKTIPASRTGLRDKKFPTFSVYQKLLKNWMKVLEEKEMLQKQHLQNHVQLQLIFEEGP